MPYLPEALRSIVDQTYEDLEIIVSDNASTDETQAVARDFAARDERIRYVRHQENIGAAGNYVHCVAVARGEFFRWQAGDDLCDTTLIERCVEILDRAPDVVQVHPRTLLIDDAGQELSRYDDDMHVVEDSAKARYLHVMRRLGLCNAIYGLTRTEVLRKTRQHSAFIGADVIALAELALYGKLWEIPEYLFYRRMHEGAYSAQTTAQQQQFYTPVKSPKRIYYHWRHLRERLVSVRRAPLSAWEKSSISAGVLREAVATRDILLRELMSAGRPLAT